MGSQSGLNGQDHWEAGRKRGSRTPGLVFFAFSALCYQNSQGLVGGRVKEKEGAFPGTKEKKGTVEGPVGGEEMRLPDKRPLCCPIPWVCTWGSPLAELTGCWGMPMRDFPLSPEA